MKNEYLKHTLATIQYRFQKSVKYRNSDFGDFTLGKQSRTPKEIINHMYSVLNSSTILILEERLEKVTPTKLDLEFEIERFISEIKKMNIALSKNELDINFSKKLLQGPFSDILTHIGQISFLTRLNNNPIEGEDYSSSKLYDLEI